MNEALRLRRQALTESWRNGKSGQEILLEYTTLVDDLILESFSTAEAVLKARGSIAVVAVGGYGRRELYPFSDVDLLLLHDWRAKKYIQGVAEALLYPLWDAGFDVGHSVRTVKDAVQFAQSDFIFQVALLDARLLTGSEELFSELKTRYSKKVLDGRRQEFVQTMQEFMGDRWQKFGSHTYLLEPHIKEGKGGLRDIQAMLWVGRGVFGLSDLAALESSGMMSKVDREALEASCSVLARVRTGLHHLGRRKSDHLVFDFQEELATGFGYQDQGGVLAVEHFMRDVYAHLQNISVITDLFFEHVHEVLGFSSGQQREEQLERFIVTRGGTVRLAQAEAVMARPHLIMRLFLQSGRVGLPLHHRTRQLVTSSLDLVDEHFRCSKRIAGIFIDLLLNSTDIFRVLESMLSTGLLTRYIPEFASVESLAQHDLYHLYTVDRHQLQCVTELHGLKESKPELFASLREPEILYLAALLHDIGKGQQTDHSVLGSELIVGIAQRLHLQEEATQTLAFLIRHHLYLPENAMRRDFSDQSFICQAAELIGDENRLTMLYLLTIADSKATGPSAWSDWKSSLLAELYLAIKTFFAAAAHTDLADLGEDLQGVAWLREQVVLRLEGRPTHIEVDQLPADYLMGFSLDSVMKHLQIYEEQRARIRQHVLLYPTYGERSWSLLIMGADKVGLLAKFFGVLALYNLKVLAAQICTWPDGTVVDALEVVPSNMQTFEDMPWQDIERDLNLAINYRLDVGYKLHLKQEPQSYGMSRQVQQLDRRVVIDNETSEHFTLVEVYGGDRLNILYQLAQTLADYDLAIHRARIATEVEQLIDVFYVTTKSGEKLTDPERIARVRATLAHIVGEEASLLDSVG